MTEYLRTDTTQDLVETLELAKVFLEMSYRDDRYWKWAIIAVHSAVQSTAALALENGDGFLVQKPGTMRRMLEVHESGAPGVDPHMDNFQRLVSRSLDKANLRSSALPVRDDALTAALASLDELRDGFAHFNVKSWSIERALIQACLVSAATYVHHYVSLTPAILWHEEGSHVRAKAAISGVRQLLARN